MRTANSPRDILAGKVILVTGGSGSFGNKFVETVIAKHSPRKVIIYSRDEFKQVQMAERLVDDRLRFFIGDVRDRARLGLAMREVDIVVHAAAMKHVPVAEYNPMECVKTNIMGAENVVDAAIAAGVSHVIALSTDKACNPINLYGATKLASDKIFIASNNLSGSIGTRFAVVRYGNVVGSRGSVVPLFERLIASGVRELPITDERMTRFWITLDHGVDFVISCLELMRGGELFVPKIPSMRIIDLARAMAPDLPINLVGIRPGEKLHEVMITEDDARSTLELQDRYIIGPSYGWPADRQPFSGEQPVAEEFRYASNTNTQWLDIERFKELLRPVG